jgi:DNA-binding NarL/FixJ family response regulator
MPGCVVIDLKHPEARRVNATREYWAKWGSASRVVVPTAQTAIGQAFAR